MAGIKETVDVLTAAEASLDAVIAAAEDGRFGALDLRFTFGPLKAAGEALKDARQVPAELKDLDQAEVDALLQKTIGLAAKVIKAVDAVTSVLGK